MLVVKLQDTKEAMFLSMLHRAEVAATGKRGRHRLIVKKLKRVHHYNRHMGGVDRNDTMLSFYTASRKSTKWYKKLATHFIKECLPNVFILSSESGGKKRHFDFSRLVLKLSCSTRAWPSDVLVHSNRNTTQSSASLEGTFLVLCQPHEKSGEEMRRLLRRGSLEGLLLLLP